jgi:GTP-binding protein
MAKTVRLSAFPFLLVPSSGTNSINRSFGILLRTEAREWTFLRGGRGGQGNTHFKSSRRQAPKYAQPGEPSSSATLIVEMNIIADIGLVGFPNAGKSSLLDTLTNAHPQIAPYPFTTKIPNLGVLKKWDKDLVIADIPGLIQGASEGVRLRSPVS